MSFPIIVKPSFRNNSLEYCFSFRLNTICFVVAGDYGETFDGEIKHFVDGLLHKRDFMKGVRGEDAVKDLKVIEAAYESSKIGTWVQIS